MRESPKGHGNGLLSRNNLGSSPNSRAKKENNMTKRAKMNLIKKEDMLETYAELFDIFDDHPNIIKELSKIYDKLNDIPTIK